MNQNRQEVNNPFKDYTAGTRPGGLVKHKADLQSRVRPRSSYQTEDKGLMIVDSLVKFAGVAGDAYVQKLSKDIEADKIEQSARAMEGLAPSDKATVAGYRAHAAISIKNKAMQEQSKLNILAIQGCTDDEWKTARRTAYENLDNYMSDTYKTYNNDKELQKLSVLTMREMMPQVTAKKIAEDMKREIQGRIDSVTDSLINTAKTGGIYKLKIEDAVIKYNTMFKALKLTPKQADDALCNAIIDTKDPKLIELSKSWTGGRKSSLYDRNSQIQKIDAMNQKVLNTTNAVGLAVEKNALNKSFLEGTMTRDIYLKSIDKRNKELKGAFMTEAEIRTKLREKDKIISSQHVRDDIVKDIINPVKTDLSEYKKKDIQGAYKEMLTAGMVKINEDVKKLPEDQKDSVAQAKQTQLIQHITDISVAKNTPIHSIQTDLHNLAQINVNAYTETKNIKDGKNQIERLPDFVERAYNTYQAMSIGSKDYYLSSLNKTDEKILRKYFNLRDMGMPNSQALLEAQAIVRNPIPYNAKTMEENVKKVKDSSTYSWFRKDFPDNQKAYMDREIRQKVGVEPMSDSNTKMVENWLKNYWTNADGLRLKGSPNVLQQQTGLHPSRFKTAIEGYINYYAPKIRPILDGRGLEMSDVFPITNPKTGTIQLSTADAPIPGTVISLSQLKEIANRDKVSKEKIWGELAKKREEENRKARIKARAEENKKRSKYSNTETEHIKPEPKIDYDIIEDSIDRAAPTKAFNKIWEDFSGLRYKQKMDDLNYESEQLKAKSKALVNKRKSAANLFYIKHMPKTGVKISPENAQKELLEDTLHFENSTGRGFIQNKFYPIASYEDTPKNSPYSKYEIGYGLKLRKDWLGDDRSKWLKHNGVPIDFKKGISQETAEGIAKDMMQNAYKTAEKAITPKYWKDMSEQEKAFYADIDYNSGSGVKSSKHALSLIRKGLNVEALVSELDFIHTGKEALRGLAKRRITSYNKAALEKTGVPIIDAYKFGKQFKVHFSNEFYTDKISDELAKKISKNNGWLVVCNANKEETDKIFKADKHFKFKE